ncbi:tRNA modification GTPase MnmE [Platysternon megacephalum]|uniref:tRNA modification GTPase MnmE n=1 Tax=Platysternon megacephalum TaxID=55544 RepID=A0A4D9DH21_9SAUR|nr:tRNA modification GTPase MnmE [Platysternon megacephalum]
MYSLSGGERQRLGIARALLRQPELLVADEITTGLDADARQQILITLQELSPHTTVFHATHDPMAIQAADTILRIKNGMLLGERLVPQ